MSMKLGRAGERLARQHLEHVGVEVIACNWRCPEGEIDLIGLETVRGHQELVFFEVKTRSSTEWGEPGEAVNFKKQQRIRSVAASFLGTVGSHGDWHECRFDVVEVHVRAGRARVEHIRDAF